MNQKLSAVLSLLLCIVVFEAKASQCQSFIPSSAYPVGELRLCSSSYSGLKQQYSCQDYELKGHHFRVIYRGGLVPKAIVRLDKYQNEKLVWSTQFGDRRMACPINAPKGMPKHAKHLGIGICVDDLDKEVPCSVYEHQAARSMEYHRFMVFYKADGSGTSMVDKQVVGANQNAMVAEIAYQLGLSLLQTDCCSEQSMAYLELAHKLFPQAQDYHAAYQHAQSVLAIDGDHDETDL
ncbi:MAG: hypothetical protein OEZ33_01440 [Gammaproteobacteria bacterium]|nr:hypothetical protein [Gammaproteobacteria bacterium]MDH5776846.1 hypothetical protein [Gammaproteobacteria bacterium]